MPEKIRHENITRRQRTGALLTGRIHWVHENKEMRYRTVCSLMDDGTINYENLPVGWKDGERFWKTWWGNVDHSMFALTTSDDMRFLSLPAMISHVEDVSRAIIKETNRRKVEEARIALLNATMPECPATKLLEKILDSRVLYSHVDAGLLDEAAKLLGRSHVH